MLHGNISSCGAGITLRVGVSIWCGGCITLRSRDSKPCGSGIVLRADTITLRGAVGKSRGCREQLWPQRKNQY